MSTGEVNLLSSCERHERIWARDIGRDGASNGRNSRVSGGANDLGGVRLGGQPRDQRVFAGAAANDHNSHRTNVLRIERGLHDVWKSGEYFVDLDGD